LEKLNEKLERLPESAGAYEGGQRLFRKHAPVRASRYAGGCRRQADVREQNAYSWDKQPFPSYELSNNNAEIKRLQKRIEEISHSHEVGLCGLAV
jgi:hypothetical protein